MNKVEQGFLYNEYIIKEKSMSQISKENNIPVGTVYNYLKKYNIKSRKNFTEHSKELISIAKKGSKPWNKGKHLNEEVKNKIRLAHKGKFKNNTEFGGHKKIRKDGYIEVYNPSHNFASKDGYVLEHRLVMEKCINRLLNKNEVVHHKNHNRQDNRIENLQLMTVSEHARLHMLERQSKIRKIKMKGEMTYQ